MHEKWHTYDPAALRTLACGYRPVQVDRPSTVNEIATDGSPERQYLHPRSRGDCHEHDVARASFARPETRSVEGDSVIRLVKLQGFSIEEAAAKTGRSVPLVNVNIHRGLARLASVVRRRSRRRMSSPRRITGGDDDDKHLSPRGEVAGSKDQMAVIPPASAIS
jgi:hypothetical protein